MIFPYTDIIRDFISYYATLFAITRLYCISTIEKNRSYRTIQQLQIWQGCEVDRHPIHALQQYDKTSIAAG
jgi:hypothetical protein